MNSIVRSTGAAYACLRLRRARTSSLNRDAICCSAYVAFWQIVLQKSKVAGPRIFRENMNREAIADSYSLNRVTEVACEFNVRR